MSSEKYMNHFDVKNITELSADQTNKIFNGDSIEIMREMPDNSVDLIFCRSTIQSSTK